MNYDEVRERARLRAMKIKRAYQLRITDAEAMIIAEELAGFAIEIALEDSLEVLQRVENKLKE
jgi:hypothetical protein